jgi:hypothetical protein
MGRERRIVSKDECNRERESERKNVVVPLYSLLALALALFLVVE